jgi:cytochrome c oxidase cbb3-type subunit III
MADNKNIDEVSGTETTGHEWDGIQELNTPLPKWWLYILYATIIWSVGYMVVYPAWPLVSDYTKGTFGYSSRADVAAELTAAKDARASSIANLENATLEDIRTNPDLLNFALAGGRSAFNVNCTQCHGSGASGSFGYPNLNDDEWLWGGTLDGINYTITHGVRNTDDDDAYVSDMPAFLKDEMLTKDEISDVANFVMTLSGQKHDQAAATRGEVLFEDNCVACHLEGGIGQSEVGAPALNNALWLYKGDFDTVVDTISNSRGGVMPAWGKILDPVTIKQLAVYVHSLGGGQ